MTYKKPYHFKKVGQTLVVVALSHERIDSYLNDISNVLLQEGFNGRIVFDLLLSNGNNSKRYFGADFEEGEINSKSIKQLSVVERRK